jgi:hypothetical protein
MAFTSRCNAVPAKRKEKNVVMGLWLVSVFSREREKIQDARSGLPVSAPSFLPFRLPQCVFFFFFFFSTADGADPFPVQRVLSYKLALRPL